MNNKTAKKLRKIIFPANPTAKKVYRRLKREYTRTPWNKRHLITEGGLDFNKKLSD